ncbi:ATP phosphoribosyltransferase [Virgibacillus dakarensis]|uniref:ATP phosphoribosyltransferase n=1 Tax=Virgibacillus dakarensis TaxID=1917889 RepID=UPI000B43F769|nr:ATP phosphoribosyltransferase [Virgibacillus dakarensis]
MSYLTLAMAKGRTADQTIKLLETAEIHFPAFNKKSRKLIFYDETDSFKLVYVKAIDVPTYVEKGAADIGIVGKDNIAEAQADVYEMMDLRFGTCQFVLAGLPNTAVDSGKKLTVASKYPAVTKAYFQKKGIPMETIKLNGSVELAPLIGLSDVIVDIVETGTTLRENGLKVIDTIEAISTRLIVNKASFATKSERIHLFLEKLNRVLEVRM